MFVGLFFIVASLAVSALINYLIIREENTVKSTKNKVVLSRRVLVVTRIALPIGYCVFNIVYWVTHLKTDEDWLRTWNDRGSWSPGQSSPLNSNASFCSWFILRSPFRVWAPSGRLWGGSDKIRMSKHLWKTWPPPPPPCGWLYTEGGLVVTTPFGQHDIKDKRVDFACPSTASGLNGGDF